MKRLLLILAFFASMAAGAQSYQPVNSWGYEWQRGMFDVLLSPPSDTFPVPVAYRSKPHLAIKNGVAYVWSPAAVKWIIAAPSETDPIYSASPAFGIASTNISNWNTAYSWGNHAGLYIQNQIASAQTATMWINGRGHFGGRLLLDSSIVLGNLSSDPATPSNGQVYYNTVSNAFRSYVNGAWYNLVRQSDASLLINATSFNASEKFFCNGLAYFKGDGSDVNLFLTTGTGANTAIRSNASSVMYFDMLSSTGKTWQWRYGNTLANIGMNLSGDQLAIGGGVTSFVGTEKLRVNGDLLAKRYVKTQQATISPTGSSLGIDLSQGEIIPITLGANITTLTLTNPLIGSYILKITQDATGGRTITWPASIKWPGGTAPTLSAASKTDIITLIYDGTNYYGSYQLNY